MRENPGLPRGNRIAGNSLENQSGGARANRVRCALASCCRRIGGLLPGRLTGGLPGRLARRLVAKLSVGEAGCSRTGIELVGVPRGAVVTDAELTGIRRRGPGVGAGIPAVAMLRRSAGETGNYLTRFWPSGVNSALGKADLRRGGRVGWPDLRFPNHGRRRGDDAGGVAGTDSVPAATHRQARPAVCDPETSNDGAAPAGRNLRRRKFPRK